MTGLKTHIIDALKYPNRARGAEGHETEAGKALRPPALPLAGVARHEGEGLLMGSFGIYIYIWYVAYWYIGY